MRDNYKYQSFEETFDVMVIIKTFENILNSVTEGNYSIANDLVFILDSSVSYLDINTKKINKYRKESKDISSLKLLIEREKQFYNGIGIKDIDSSRILWYNLYSLWFREIVKALAIKGKLGKKTGYKFVEDDR